MTIRAFAVTVILSSLGLAGCGAAPGGESSIAGAAGAATLDVEGNPTLMFVPPGTAQISELAETTSASAVVRVFYPKPGQGADGICWTGLTSDGAGNLYPIANAGFSKLDHNANVLNGQDDTNYFATEGNSMWGVLDEPVRKMFTASLTSVRSAPFRAGAVFSDLIGGLKTSGAAVALGRGPFAGSLFVTDVAASRVYRVTLQPLALKLYASGPLFKAPEAIGSGPDGSVYVVNVGSETDPAGRRVIKIAANGSASVFATAKDTTARRMLAVGGDGTVYWSSAKGIDRFKPNGARLKALPGPSDQAAFENPMGSAFDPQGNLYVVENFGCKKIYKYLL